MKLATAALVAVLTVLPGTAAIAQVKQKTGSIRYTFLTLLIPDRSAERSKTVKKNEPWFMGKAVPAHAVVLDAPLALLGTAFVIAKGSPLSVATSENFIACQKELTATVGLFGGGKSPICLIDRDGDRAFDGWYTSSVDILWNSYAGHIQRDDIHPIAPVTPRELSPAEVRELAPWGTFAIRYAQGMLTYCLGIGDTCLQKSPKIKPSDAEQTAEFLGGLFGYRKLADGRFAVRMIRDPQEATY